MLRLRRLLRPLAFAVIPAVFVASGFQLGAAVYPSVQEQKLKEFKNLVHDQAVDEAAEVCIKYIEDNHLVPEYTF